MFNVQRFSLHDGPGIRTTVFLKGCPLRCQWCHNPEGQEQQPQIRLTMSLCRRCGRCVEVCEQGVHEVTPEAHLLNPPYCVRCGRCVEVCPAGALEMVGRRMSAEEVMSVVRRDIPFYEQSHGGMTLSGGEPMAQHEFSKALLESARADAIHTAVETCAFAPWEELEEIGPLVNLFLVDLKHTDEARHIELTGVSNKGILSNIERMVAAGWPVILRIPWVPTRNAEDGFLEGLQSFLARFPTPPPVEFMLYHRLGVSKWAALGGESAVPEDLLSARAEDASPWVKRLRAAGISVIQR